LVRVGHEALAGLSERGTKSVKKIYGVFEFFPENSKEARKVKDLQKNP